MSPFPQLDNLSPDKSIWILLTLAAVVLPHLLHLPIWVVLACVALGCWRYYASRKRWKTPKLWVRAILIFASLVGIFFSYQTVLGRDAGVALLILMISLKLLELNSRRDIMLFLFMAYFLVITNFLFNQSVYMAIYMFAVIIGITTTIMLINHPRPRPDIADKIKKSTILAFQAIPVMLVIFILFPRINGPLWELPKDAHSGATGLNEHMSPGDLSELIFTDTVAFRVYFDQGIPNSSSLYWRGPVLNAFDGRTWSPSTTVRGDHGQLAPSGPSISYTVSLEPHNKHWLFALDIPTNIPVGSYLSDQYQLLSYKPIYDRIQYQVTSHPRFTRARPLSPEERRVALALPKDSNVRSVALAQEFRSLAENDVDVVKKVLHLFRSQPFVYTLRPPLLRENAVDQFLFKTRRGFCEHYASAFVLLMRAAGIPARVVTGYQGGEYNPVGNYLVVRQWDAHAWAEIWLGPRGWVRIDPTGAVAPERIEEGIEAAVGDAYPITSLMSSGNFVLRQMAYIWDSLHAGWNVWVLGYDPERQADLLQRMGLGAITWHEMAVGLALLVTTLFIILAITMSLSYRRKKLDPALALYQKFCKRLEKKGITRHTWEGPKRFAERVAREQPQLGEIVAEITELYIASRYRRRRQHLYLRRLRTYVWRFILLPKYAWLS